MSEDVQEALEEVRKLMKEEYEKCNCYFCLRACWGM